MLRTLQQRGWCLFEILQHGFLIATGLWVAGCHIPTNFSSTGLKIQPHKQLGKGDNFSAKRHCCLSDHQEAIGNLREWLKILF